MSLDATTLERTMRAPSVAVRARPRGRPSSSALDEFEQVYRGNVDVLMGYFARRCRDPQTVADLTSETFVRAVEGFAGFDPRRGTDRAWLFGIATRVFARHCERLAVGRDAIARLGGHRILDGDEIEELTERIDAEREGAILMQRCAQLPKIERAAIELVDLEGLSPKEAALALGVSRVAFRVSRFAFRVSRFASDCHERDPGCERSMRAVSKFADSLWRDLVRDHGPTLAHAARPEPGPVPRRRPRVLAGSTLGLAGVGAALVVALSAGGAAAPPAFAVTRQHDGSVMVRVNVNETTEPWVLRADRELAAMGIDEQIGIDALQPGAATVSGPVSCTPLGGANTPAGPPVRVLLGKDGTGIIPAGNTGAGTVHMNSCVYYKSASQSGLGNTGNTGAG